MVTLGLLKGTHTSGPVKKMLHVPSLQIFAVKELPLLNRDVRFHLKEKI